MTVHSLKQWLSTWRFEYRRWFGRRTWLLLGAVVIAYIYLLSDYGIYNLWVQKRQADDLQQEIAELQQEREELLKLKKQLESQDPQYIEKIARERYGMVRKGETLYRVRPDETPGVSK